MKNVTLQLTLTGMALAALTACGGGGSDSASTSTGTTTTTSAPIPLADCGLPDFKNEVLSRLNAYRTSGLVCGTEVMPPTMPVVWNEDMQKAATTHATDMATHDSFSHTGSDGSTAFMRARAAGYSGMGPGYENIAVGYPTVEQAMDSWRKSPAHCKAMMADTNTIVGVSCVAKPDTFYKFFWVMELAA